MKMKLKNWHKDYLRIIFPKTAVQDLQINASECTYKELHRRAGIAIAIFESEVFGRKHQDPSLVDRYSSDFSYFSCLEWIGRLTTFESSSKNEVGWKKLIFKFERLLSNEYEKVCSVVQHQVCSAISENLLGWRTFVKKCDDPEKFPEFWTYWNVTLNDFADQNDPQVENSPEIVKGIEWVDLTGQLVYRTFLFELVSFARPNFDITDVQTELETIDNRYRKASLQSDFVLSAQNRRIYPEEYFWWYYRLPKDIQLIDSPFI